MVRETRHLWVGNLPDNIREDRIREHFKRYGRVQSVKLLPRSVKEETGENTTACTVAFMDIKSASKAHTAEHKIDDRTLTTEYYEPAAIPSAASPQNTNSTYSTSPGSTRFANSHGTTDEHGNFNERFYERNNSRVAEGEYIRRPSYHDSRGRNRDRAYRNGPYNNVIDRHRPLNNSWSYDSSRSYNSETGYGTTPSDTNDRRSSDSQSTKKKTKSRSGSRSVSPSGSTSSRSPTRSRSQSSSSSSSSTTSQASSSTSSPKSRRVAASANASHQPVVHSDDRRPLAICVRNLPLRSSDTSLKDGLFHEYKKHGKVTWVKIVGQGSERHAIVCFKKPEDVDKALEVSYDKLFFGCKIEVAPYQGYDVDDNELRPYEAEIDEFHPKATRTLFIGNLEKDVTASDLRKHFDQFGEIIEIDIKKQGAVSSYAFCQYSDIISVVKAIRAMDGEHLGNNRIKLGFGKSMPTNCVWVDGVVDSVNEKYLTLQFDSFGPITQVIIDRDKGQALIFYEQVVNAQAAVAKMRGVNMRGRKMQVDFASRECQEAFYEHLEKQGHTAERANFEERRDSTSTRSFDATVTASTRFTRYETTPARPRTASYSSRTGATTVQCNATATVHSPSTPGSVTPRGSGSRSRLARFAEYYDQNATTEYGERRYRSYDEYSQGSAASHEEGYEHEYAYNRESPSHVDPLEARSLQHGADHLALPFAPPDIRNLQKERYHLLEQLEDYPSSGDELVSPKKRIRLDILEGSVASDVIIEANRDHRKVMEVRRTSEGSLKHHSRRPSLDSKHGAREVGIERAAYMPHAVCKRRKTAGSDSSARLQHHDLSGSESVGSSRPGTPLCDERPENFPTEPRRIPREREGPLSLPLPRFAAQVMGKGSVSVAGIKGQKDNILASPPPAATSPRISNPVTPSLAQVPPPASPPPRPPSLSSNSSDSDGTPPSPSLDERIRSLDEKYEKWSGSRAVSAAGSEALAKLDATASERFKFSYKLLDLDLKELQPSEIVKSVLAKPSVFDEDSKRLENVGEKYESLFSKAPTTVAQPSIPAAPLSAPPVLKVSTPTTQLPKTPTMLSPRSAGSNITTAKSLQYPFPSHPPVQPVISATTAPTPTLQTPPLTSASTRGNHGDNRLKPCANAATSDNRTSCKVGITRSVSSSGVVISNLTQVKISEPSNTSKNGVNIPVNPSDTVQSGNANPNIVGVDANSTKQTKSARESKSSDKNSDKITNRRDSTSSGGSPRSEIKNRRNSESSGRRTDVGDKQSDICDTSLSEKKSDEKEKNEEWKKEQQKLENERLEKERLEKERIEKERLEKERLEKERLEKERLEKERLERERLEKERLEKERLERERLEKERLEKERIEREHKREREERERKEREEKERREREEQERLEKERKERREREEKERREREEKERREREDRERKEKEEQERLERERKREEDRKHKEDNHEKRKEEHFRHRENHGEIKHKENAETVRNDKNTKETKTKDGQELFRKDSHESRNSHDNKSSHENRERHNNEIRKEEKSKHHIDRDTEKRKESSKENRENNLHDKIANIANEVKENNKPSIESRHFSIDLDKNKIDLSRRKERNNSLPANVGSKRRMSSQDSLEMVDEIKKIKLSQEHRKISERRDSKDTRSEDKVKSKHKNNIAKIIEDKMRQEKFNSVKEVTEEKRKDKERDKDEKHKHKQKIEKQKSKEKIREKDSPNSTKPPSKDLSLDKEFLARLELQSTEESEKLQRQRKEAKEKRKQESRDSEERKSDDAKKSEERKKEKRSSSERKSRDENPSPLKIEDRNKLPKKERSRKATHNSSDAATDSDEPKKQPHSIFDIVDDEPAYISMYDKVKARSCKNMQKQEEEKRQEKLKAKFSQLKQSRAKREEKKRSTSWDEDSDSDHERRERSSKSDGSKSRRGTKMLIMSSDDDEHGSRSKQRKKREIYTDSDSDKHRQTKSEHMETSDDENVKNKSIQRKNSKSRIASDTSDDEFKKVQDKIKSEIFSDDNELDPRFVDLEEKPHKRIKDEDSKYIKKEKKNKHELTTEQINAQIFGESPLPEVKSEDKFDNGRVFADVSSAEETHESKKEKSEMRKKHKKKQKRQKHSLTSEEDTKLELTVELIKDESIDRMKNCEKKKQHSKKDKKKDKNKDEEKHKDKSKKSKKSKSDPGKSESKRDGKMENIFGSFSDDSENGNKDQERSNHTQSTFLDRYGDEKLQYGSDSDSISHIEKEIHKSEEKDRKEEHKKRKEKKRREKEKRLREEELNENSMDYIDMGKQLEANIKDDSNDMLDATTTSIKSEPDDRSEDVFRFTEGDESQEIKIEQDRKEGKEKKKKRKKSKEEKHKHHHHHHDKNKLKSPEIKKEFDLPPESIKTETEKPIPQSPSLPNILDLPSPPLNKASSLDYSLSPVSSIPKTPTSSKEKKRDKFIPGFGTEIDEKVHETAIKSISEFETPKSEITNEIKEEVVKTEKTEVSDDKPRVIISQEETEDAVAALLGESFGGNEYSSCYTDEQPSLVSTEQESSVAEENIVEDLEEMRQAVQSLNSADLEIKPDTPQSEHELQIDTDTDEQEDIGLRYDQSPRTPDMIDLSQPPKTPDIPSYFRSEDQTKATLVIKATNLSNPPSLTPIKPPPLIADTKRIVENIPVTSKSSTPILPTTAEPRPVITKTWPPVDPKPVNVPSTESTPIKTVKIDKSDSPPTAPATTVAAAVSVVKPTIGVTTKPVCVTTSSLSRSYTTPPTIKIEQPPLKSLSVTPKQEPLHVTSTESVAKSHSTPVLQSVKSHVSLPSLPYNMSVHMQYNTTSQQKQQPLTSVAPPGLHVPKVSTPNVPFNRLPITPIMMSKPFQPTTVALPQPKLAQTTDAGAPGNAERNLDQTKVLYQAGQMSPFLVNPQSQTRMLVQNMQLPRGIPPQPVAKHVPPVSFGYPSSSLSQPSYFTQAVTKEVSSGNSKPTAVLTSTAEPPRLVPTSFPVSYSLPAQISQPSQVHSPSVISDAKQSNASVAKQPNAAVAKQPNASVAKQSNASVADIKPFMPVIQETPKLVSLSSTNVSSPSIIQSAPKTSTTQPFVTTKPKPILTIEVKDEKEGTPPKPSKESPIIVVNEQKKEPAQIEKSVEAVTKKEATPEPQPKPQLQPQLQPQPQPQPKLQPQPQQQQQQLAVAKVMEELNISLKEEQETPAIKQDNIKSEVAEDKSVLEKVPDVNKQAKVEESVAKTDSQEIKVVKVEPETPSVIKKTDKLEDDKGETESIESDISKERLSADLVNKDDGLDSKEDSDYWSAKEVNIDSVIKKVDALCSADELSDRSSEIGKDDWYDQEMKTSIDSKPEPVEIPPETIKKVEEVIPEIIKAVESEPTEEENEHPDGKEIPTRGGRRGGRGSRGRKARGIDRGGVQTRRTKVIKEEPVPVIPVTVAKRGGRGGRPKSERKIPKSESETADVYEFRDDSDENNVNKDRPRLILTIKSPAIPNSNTNTQTAIVKEVPPIKDSVSPKPEKPEIKEDFVSPTNTRKSRRLQERDVSRNTVDDTIEDVVRNTAIVTRSTAAAQAQIRRSARQTAIKAVPETPRKSPRGAKKKDRRASETTDDSSEEKSVKNESITKPELETSKLPVVVVKEPVKDEEEQKIEAPKEKPHEGLKAAVLRRVKGEMNHQEPMTLIDPVTGLLTPMREYEEGRYIPVSGGGNQAKVMKLANVPVKPIQTTQAPPTTKPVEAQPQSVIASSSAVIQQHKPQSLKAHVLSSQAARVVVSQQQPQKLVSQQPPKVVSQQQPQKVVSQQQPQKVVSQQQPQKAVTVAPPVSQPTFVVKSSVPISQHLNVSVSSPNLPPAHVSPRPSLPPNISKTMHTLPPGIKMAQQPAPPSPNQVIAHVNQPKPQQHILQPINKQPQSTVSKAHHAVPVVTNAAPVVNTQMAHMKQQVVIGKGQVIKPHSMHPQPQILTGAVASPPLKQTHHVNQQPIAGASSGRLVQGSASVPSASAKNSMEPPKVEVSMAGCVMVPHPTSSPQGQPRHIGLPIPAFEASLHGERSVYNRSRSPPPAHQNSPSPQGEAMTHFPPGSVKLRTPHDLLPAHYMHPQHVMYQQYLRQSYHLPRSPLVSGNIEKTGDGQEGEEAPVELRRPGSVGLALTGRSPAVPHSLQSPHDRTTDSPQVGQVYNMHNTRMQHYHPGRYYDQAAEPPPAHRPLTSHGSLAALGSDRSLSHIGTLGTPDRPLSSHLPPDRPLSSHLPPDRPLSSHSALAAVGHINNLGVPDRPLSTTHLPDRPLSSHGFTLGTGLGAAGNLMGAVARHIGAEAPASQRGLQAATPPHASQVPPQAESLLMLLKQYPCMWQGLLALKNDQAAVQMYFVSGNDQVAKCSLPKNTDGSTPPLRIFQRMRLEPPQVEGVARKMQMENEHCMLLALPCGHDHMDVLKQSTNLTNGFITYLQQKQAAGIVNVAAPGTTQPPAYVVHIFPSCDFVNENLRRIAPNLLERVSDIAHLLIVITTV